MLPKTSKVLAVIQAPRDLQSRSPIPGFAIRKLEPDPVQRLETQDSGGRSYLATAGSVFREAYLTECISNPQGFSVIVKVVNQKS
jgi:hypothetical protein